MPYTAKDQSSINTYGRKAITLTSTIITRAASADRFLTRYLENFSTPQLSHSFRVIDPPDVMPYDTIKLQTLLETISTAPLQTIEYIYGGGQAIGEFTTGAAPRTTKDMLERLSAKVSRFGVQPVYDGQENRRDSAVHVFKIVSVDGDNDFTVRQIDSSCNASYSDDRGEYTFDRVSVASGHSSALSAGDVVLGVLISEADDDGETQTILHLANFFAIDTT